MKCASPTSAVFEEVRRKTSRNREGRGQTPVVHADPNRMRPRDIPHQTSCNRVGIDTQRTRFKSWQPPRSRTGPRGRFENAAAWSRRHHVALSSNGADSCLQRHRGLVHDQARRVLDGNGEDWGGDDVWASRANLHQEAGANPADSEAAPPDAGSIDISQCRIGKEGASLYVDLWPVSDDHAIQ